MTTEMWIIALMRVLGSLPVLRWPFYGAVVAMLADQADLLLMNLLDLGGVTDYQTFDKYLDQVYLALFLVVAWRIADRYSRGETLRERREASLLRGVSVGLYAYRLAGFAAFELTGERGLLLFFPNLFESWYLFIAARAEFRLEERLPLVPAASSAARDNAGSRGTTAGLAPAICVLGALAALKLFQEYALHQARWLDGFTTVDALKAIWHFVTPF